jgi:hypothetical protein
MITKTKFDSMKEDLLRTDVLIPLLNAVGFKGVHENHGQGEHGKDILGWKEYDSGRTNYAIVAKAVQMTGQARSAPSSASELITQINQCLNSTYEDLKTNEVQSVHNFWVMSNKPIRPAARTGISSGLDASKLRYVKFFDNAEVWALVSKYLPVSMAQTFDEGQALSSAMDTYYEPHWEITLSTKKVRPTKSFQALQRKNHSISL